MLINLTNHPSEGWVGAQMAEALAAYGSITDMPFPQIPPHFSSAEVGALAWDYFEKVAEHHPEAVHLMGEATFTFALVSLLKANGIPCIASTTERIVTLEENGEKRTQFKFVRFREY